MLEIFDQIPQTRVFHVDEECYIVYLGSHWDDYKPFLRLGTSTHLPSELLPIVSSIVVPDALTGNPIDEPACLPGNGTRDMHYVGDVETAEQMKSFVGRDGIPVEAIQIVDHEEDDDKHVFVYYYKDGNLKIKYRRTNIFDLQRREKLDSHFVARAQDAKNRYGKGPFKLPGEVYQQAGFLVLAGVPYLIARGEIAALRLTDEYFFNLSAAGIDADRVSTVYAQDADPALIRFFKRSRTRDNAIRVATFHSDRIRQAAKLFPANTLPALKAKRAATHDGSFAFHDYRVVIEAGRYEVALGELDGSIVFASGAERGPDAMLTIDPGSATISFGRSRTTHPLIEGALYQFAGPVSRAEAKRRFLPEKNYPYRDLLSPSEVAAIQQLEYFFTALDGARDTAKVVRTLKGLDPIRTSGEGESSIHPVMQIVLHNYWQYATLVRAQGPESKRDAEPLVTLLERHRIVPEDVPAMLPLVGEICLRDSNEYLFYRFAARITGDRYDHADQVAQHITGVPKTDYGAERKRLLDLIAMLATPEQMSAARARRIEESKVRKSGSKARGDGSAEEHRSARGDRSADGRARVSRGTDPTTENEAAAVAAASRGGAAPRATKGRAEDGSDRTNNGPADVGEAAGSRASGGPREARPAPSTLSINPRPPGRRTVRGRDRQLAVPWLIVVAAVGLLIVSLLALLMTGTIRNEWFEALVSPGPVRERLSIGPRAPGDPDSDDAPPDDSTSDGSSPDDQHSAAPEPNGGDGDVSGADGTNHDPATAGDRTIGREERLDSAETMSNEEGTSRDGAVRDSGSRLPAGWPSDSTPAIRALEDTPGVTITDTRVIGPGGIEITLHDIIGLVNRVATDNGYARLGAANDGRPNPDLIYPGNVFALPDGRHYTVVRGDTLWGITVRYMVARLRDDYELYVRIVTEHETETTLDSRRIGLVEQLSAIGEATHTENFRRMVEETLDRWAEQAEGGDAD
jgi:hypothetical protein